MNSISVGHLVKSVTTVEGKVMVRSVSIKRNSERTGKPKSRFELAMSVGLSAHQPST